MTEQESNAIRDAVASAIGGVAESMSQLLERRKTSEPDEPDKTDDINPDNKTDNDVELGHRAVEQYINAMNAGDMTGKTI